LVISQVFGKFLGGRSFGFATNFVSIELGVLESFGCVIDCLGLRFSGFRGFRVIFALVFLANATALLCVS